MSNDKTYFNFFERSNLEKISFKESKGIQNVGIISEQTNNYLKNLIENHIFYVAQRAIYQKLGGKEFIKNPGVALEYFLIDYLGDKIKLDKRESEIWEKNHIDMFYKHLGIELTVEDKINNKQKKIKKNREKINSGENFKCRKSNKYKNSIIPNNEVPKNLGLFQFKSEIIRGLVNSGETNIFLSNIQSLTDKEFIKFYNDMEIVKKSFPFIIDKINYIEKNRDERLKLYTKNSETDINNNSIEHERYIKKVNEWIDNGIKGEKPKEIEYKKSNINYLYNPEEQILFFKVYSTNNIKEQNNSTLIYNFEYYFCDKKNVNNLNEKAIGIDRSQKNSQNDKKIELTNNHQVEGNGDFFNYIKAINDYNKIIEKSQNYIKKNEIDINYIENKKLDEFITYLEENNESYSKLLILLKNINMGKNNQKYKQDFIDFNRENKKLIKFKKRDSWIISFLNNLKKIEEGAKIDIKNFNIGTFNDKKLILSDPIIKKNNLGKKSEELDKKLKFIKKIFIRTELDEGINGKLILSLQRLLFSDNRKYNRGIKDFNKIIENIKEEKEKNIIKIEELKINNNLTNSEENNKKIKKINSINDYINLLIKKLNIFREEIEKVRKKINSINFEDIIFSKKRKNSVYTKKFLYTTLIDIIFEGNFVAIKNNDEERLKERLRKNLKGNNENINIYELLEIIKNKQNNIEKGNNIINNNLEQKLYKNIKKLQNILDVNKKDNSELENKIENNYENIFSILENIKNIMIEFYPKEIVELNENRILNFAKNIHNLNFNTFDNELKNLIKKLPLTQSSKYNNIFKKIEGYKDLYDYIDNLEKEESTFSNEEVDFIGEESEEIDFIGETEKINKYIDKINENMIKIKEIMNKEK